MKKLLLLCVAGICLYACNDNATDTAATDTAKDTTHPATPPIDFPYKASYSSDFEMGDPSHAKIVLDVWKDFDNNTLDNAKNSFADTVTMQLADGSVMSGPRDSIIAGIKGYRAQFSALTSSIDAFVALKSKDKNTNWVNVWGKEVRTDLKGKKDSSQLAESWMLNDQNKIAFMLQYAAKTWPE